MHSLVSLRKLKKDYDNVPEATINRLFSDNLIDLVTSSSTGMFFYCIIRLNLVTRVKECSLIQLNRSSIKEVFDIDEIKIKQGLTKENIGNASVLQLFYLVIF